MLITYVKCLFKETKELIERFGFFQSLLATSLSLVAYYSAFNLVDHLKTYQVEITSSIVIIIFFFGGYMTWKKEYNKSKELLKVQKDNIIVIECEPIWFQIGSYFMNIKIKNIRLYFKFNIQNHKNHTVRIESVNLGELEKSLNKKASKIPVLTYQNPLPLEVSSKSPKNIGFYYEYDFSKLSFPEQVTLLEELSSERHIISFKAYSIDGWDTVETQLKFDLERFLSSTQVAKYNFDEKIIADCRSRISPS